MRCSAELTRHIWFDLQCFRESTTTDHGAQICFTWPRSEVSRQVYAGFEQRALLSVEVRFTKYRDDLSDTQLKAIKGPYVLVQVCDTS